MNNNLHSSPNEYIVTIIVTIIALFSLCLCVELQLYFNIESIINKRQLAMKKLVKFYKLEQLENMHSADPGNYMVMINLAKAYESVEQYSKSNELYKNAIITSQNSDYALYSYAIFSAKMGWYSLSCDLAEKLGSSKKKLVYKYKTEIYYELAKNFDKNNEVEASVKAYQIAYKYAKNAGKSKLLKEISTGYAKEYVKLADYNIEQKNIETAILDLKNSLSIKELDIAKYKLGLIYKDTDKIAAEKYFNQVLKTSPYMINPYIYNSLLTDLINESKNGADFHNADFYSVRLNNLKNKIQEYYIYKGDILFSKSHISMFKKLLGKEKKYILYFNIKNNTKLNINNLYIKADIVINNNTYEASKKAVTNSSPLEAGSELKDIELDLPGNFNFIDNDKKNKQNSIIVNYYVKKQKKAPWTLAKIEFIKF